LFIKNSSVFYEDEFLVNFELNFCPQGYPQAAAVHPRNEDGTHGRHPQVFPQAVDNFRLSTGFSTGGEKLSTGEGSSPQGCPQVACG